MSSYLPPLQTSLSIFNPSYWEYGSGYLTYTTAYQLFLSINGNETIGGLVRFAGGIDTDNIGPIGSGDALSITTTGPINLTSTLFNLNGTSDDTGNRTGLQAGTESNINYLSIYAGGQDVADFAQSFVNINQGLYLYNNGTQYGAFTYNNGNLEITPNTGNLMINGNLVNSSNQSIGTPQGTVGSVQYNNSGSFAGISSFWYYPSYSVLIDSGSLCHSSSFTNNPSLFPGQYHGQNYAGQYEADLFNVYTTPTSTQNPGFNFYNSLLSSSPGTPSNFLLASLNSFGLSLGSLGQTSISFGSGGLRSFSPSIQCFNGTISSSNGSVSVSPGYTGFLLISTWTSSGNWAYAIGMANSGSIILSNFGSQPSIGSSGASITISNNTGNNPVYYSIWMLTDGVNG